LPRTNERTFLNQQEIRVYKKSVKVMAAAAGVVVVTPANTSTTTTMGVIR
jgi:hypothetical protein